MKKIVIFNGFYYPSKNCGGPMTSVENIVNTCSDEFDFYIVCYNHDFGDKTPFDLPIRQWTKWGLANVMYVDRAFIDYSVKRMGAFIDELKPDLMWFSGVLNPNKKIVAAINGRKKHIPVLYSPRGEVSADRVVIKGYKKIPYLYFLRIFGIYKNCFFHGTSDDEIEGLKRFFNPDPNHLFKVPNIAIRQQPDMVTSMKKEGELHAMFFSRIHEVKNLLYAIKCVSKCHQKITYDIYGPIESEAYWEECKKTAESAPQNISVNYKGILSKEELGKAIQEHDCFLFPTINENYGHVIAESLANSRPVILSKGTTPWDDLDGKAGAAIPLEAPDIFTEKLDYYASLTNQEFEKIIVTTKKYFSDKIMADSAIQGHKKMFNDIIGQYE